MPKATPTPSPFTGATAKFMIGSIDRPALGDVTAQFNPKELQYERAVPWTPHDLLALEFARGWQGRSLTVELLFDGVEKHQSVAAPLALLETFATVIDPMSRDDRDLRPHFCVAKLGEQPDVPTLRCVIESLTIKYLQFARDGKPLRATATVKLKEADLRTKGKR